MIKYPGRDPLTAKTFVNSIRTDFLSYKICDISLSTGSLLYNCAEGGFGFTKEGFVIDMHNFWAVRSCVSMVRRSWVEDFKSGQSETHYLKQRKIFNSKTPRITNWSDCCRLHCLLTASGYANKYSNKSYSASYFPYGMDFDALQNHSNLVREKKPNLLPGDLFTFKESVLDENTIIHFHMPGRFDKYGYNYVWSRRKMEHVIKAFNELNELGKKICLSTLYESRGLLVHAQDLFPSFNKHIVTYSDDNRYGFNRRTTEIYYVNF